MEEMKTKVCAKCKRELPVTEFHRNKATKDGLQSHCKECAKHYDANKKQQKKLLPVYTNPELSKFQPRDLLAELKARGYEWEKMYAPRQEVLYSKV